MKFAMLCQVIQWMRFEAFNKTWYSCIGVNTNNNLPNRTIFVFFWMRKKEQTNLCYCNNLRDYIGRHLFSFTCISDRTNGTDGKWIELKYKVQQMWSNRKQRNMHFLRRMLILMLFVPSFVGFSWRFVRKEFWENENVCQFYKKKKKLSKNCRRGNQTFSEV